MCHWENPSECFYKVGVLLNGKNGFEIKSTGVFATSVCSEHFRELYKLKTLVIIACLSNSNFSAAGELERLHGNFHLPRAVKESPLEVF